MGTATHNIQSADPPHRTGRGNDPHHSTRNFLDLDYLVGGSLADVLPSHVCPSTSSRRQIDANLSAFEES
jgi:hypothetical protein